MGSPRLTHGQGAYLHCLAEHPGDSITAWLCSMESARDPSYSSTPLGLPFSFLEIIPLRMVLLHADLIPNEMRNCNLALSFFLQWSAGECFCTWFFFFNQLWHGWSFPEYWGLRHWGILYHLVCVCHSNHLNRIWLFKLVKDWWESKGL